MNNNTNIYIRAELLLFFLSLSQGTVQGTAYAEDLGVVGGGAAGGEKWPWTGVAAE